MSRLLSCLLFLAPVAWAGQAVTLAWDPSPSPDVGGYKLYWGGSSRAYTNAVDVGNVCTNTLTNLPSCTVLYFAVTAYTTNGLESDFSNEVHFKPCPPGNLRLVMTLQTAGDPAGPWQERTNSLICVAPEQVQFYRGLVRLER